jgi:NADPH-dependent 2,4-dienoyl-CoA reductase/sulfur reductase-like enzyme
MNVLIIGGSHAGIAAARRIREVYPEVNVHIFEKSSSVSFVSQSIPLFLMGKRELETSATYTTPEELEKEGIQVSINTEVTKVSAKEKWIRIKEKGKKNTEDISYDKLILATGSYPSLPPTGGELGKTLFVLKNGQDAKEVEDFINQSHRVVVIGGGLVGVEVARILNRRNLDVTLIHSHERILNRYLDSNLARIVEDHATEEGVRLLLNQKAVHFREQKSSFFKRGLVEVTTSKGNKVECDGVIMGVGFRPNSLLVNGQVEIGNSGAIQVNEYMQTSDPDIFAVGDCSTTYIDLSKVYAYTPHASEAIRQGMVAGQNIMGNVMAITKTQETYKFNMEAYSIARTGLLLTDALKAGWDAEAVEYTYEYLGSDETSTMQLVFEKGTRKILGFQVIGEVDLSPYVNIMSLAIQQDLTINDLELSDFYFEHGPKNPFGFTKILAYLVREKEKKDRGENYDHYLQ